MKKSMAVRYDRGSPVIAFINRSQDVDEVELRRAIRAIQTQVDRDFFPAWGWRAKLVFQPQPMPKRAMLLTIKTKNSDSDLGYHFIQGVPRTEVFTRDAEGEPYEEYYSTLSHEVLEMIADPGINLYASGYYRKGRLRRNAWIPYEVCDPVEENLYEIDGFKMSDFVLPEWYEPERKARSVQFSHRNSVDRPFELAPGGYIDAVVGHTIRTVSGPDAKRKSRRHRLAARQRALEHGSR
jgi:hypothetical protein